MSRVESVDPWKAREPACCVGVETVKRNLGGVTLRTYGEAVCPSGCHRVVEQTRGEMTVRTVTDLRTGSPNAVWNGVKR